MNKYILRGSVCNAVLCAFIPHEDESHLISLSYLHTCLCLQPAHTHMHMHMHTQTSANKLEYKMKRIF